MKNPYVLLPPPVPDAAVEAQEGSKDAGSSEDLAPVQQDLIESVVIDSDEEAAVPESLEEVGMSQNVGSMSQAEVHESCDMAQFDLEALMACGFDQGSSEKALEMCGSMEAALQHLFDQTTGGQSGLVDSAPDPVSLSDAEDLVENDLATEEQPDGDDPNTTGMPFDNATVFLGGSPSPKVCSPAEVVGESSDVVFDKDCCADQGDYEPAEAGEVPLTQVSPDREESLPDLEPLNDMIDAQDDEVADVGKDLCPYLWFFVCA